MRSTPAGATIRRRASSRLLAGSGWLVTAALLAVALARLVAWDARSTLVAANALTPVLYLPVWVVAVSAAVTRRWALTAAAAVVVIAHLSFALPEVLASEDLPGVARSAPSIRLFDGNMYAHNDRAAAYGDEIRRDRPDLVVLQEVTTVLLRQLDAAGVFAGLPYRMTVARQDPFAAMVVSRWPLEEQEVTTVGDRPVLMRATIEPVVGRPVRLFAVHTLSPVASGRADWIAGLDAVRDAVRVEKRPILVAGDFNATWGHRHFRALVDSGLTDAAVARGHPFAMTWPRNRSVLPPLVRIDHVLTTDGLAVTRIATGVGPGSDHRPLVADVAVLR